MTERLQVYKCDVCGNTIEILLEEGQKDKETERDRLSKIIEKTFLTDTGKRLAREALLGEKQ